MTHDTQDAALLRRLLADASMPTTPTRDLVGPALRDGHRRARRRRLAGVAVATGLSCAAAVTAPPLLRLARPGPSGTSAGSLWAPDSTREGEVLNRLADDLVIAPGPQSSVTAPAIEGDAWTMGLRDWRISWRHAGSEATRSLVASLDGADLVVRADGDAGSERILGRVPLTDPVTALAVRVGDGDGWVALVVGTATGPGTFTAQMHLRGVGVGVDVDDSLTIGGARGSGFSAARIDDRASVLSAMRFAADTPVSPFETVDGYLTGDTYSEGSTPPPDGSVTRVVAVPVIVLGD